MNEISQSIVRPEEYAVIIVENNKDNRELLEIAVEYYLLNIVGSFMNNRDFLAFITDSDLRKREQFADKQILIIADQRLDDGNSLAVLDDKHYQAIGMNDMWLVYSTDDVRLRRRLVDAQNAGFNIEMMPKPLDIHSVPGKINNLREKRDSKNLKD